MVAATLSIFLAAAGGGSSGFGGGGGGGGGSFGGGGGFGGSGSGGSATGGLIIFGFILLAFVVLAISTWVGARRYRRKRAARVVAVRRASAEAAEDDAYFEAEAVERQAEALFISIQQAWDARDMGALGALAGHDLLEEWRLRLEDFANKGWHNRVEVLNDPMVEYCGLVNREDDAEDRVVMRIEALLRDYVQDANGHKILHNNQKTDRSQLCEYWTLARNGDRWILVSIEQKAEGDHNLDAEIVASPWGDTQRLTDEALVETAATAKAGAGFTTADLVDPGFAANARAAALDLSLADARFSPDVISTAVRRAVAGWVEAVDGPDEALARIASPEAVRALLHPGDSAEPPRTRLVVRGASIRRISVQELMPSPEPARVRVAVLVSGRRYIEDRDTAAVLSGSQSSETDFEESWVLALSDDDAMPWKLVAAGG